MIGSIQLRPNDHWFCLLKDEKGELFYAWDEYDSETQLNGPLCTTINEVIQKKDTSLIFINCAGFRLYSEEQSWKKQMPLEPLLYSILLVAALSH